MLSRHLAVVLLFLSTFPLFAQSPPLFEAVLSGSRNQCGPSQPPNARGLVWINPDRVDLSTDPTTYIAAIGSADDRRVLALQRQPGPAFRVVEVRPDGTVAPVSAPIVGFEPIAIDVGTNGRIFALAFQAVPGTPNFLFVMSPAGAVEATYPLGTGTGDLAVGNDNCTVYFIQSNVVRRFNACTGTALPDFTPPGDYSDIFVLPDGRVLVSTDTSVLLYNADGTLNRTVVANAQTAYGLNTTSFVTEVALSPDGQTLYIAISVNCNFSSNGRLLRVAFANGAELSRRNVDVHGIGDLILGAPAAPAPGAANVPTASEWMLMLLAITLAAVGVWSART